MLSLTGIPPTIGFWGKFYLFTAVVDAGYTWLAIVAVIMSSVSAYYYLRVVWLMYFRERPDELDDRARPGRSARSASASPWASPSLGVLVVGLYPQPVLRAARRRCASSSAADAGGREPAARVRLDLRWAAAEPRA